MAQSLAYVILINEIIDNNISINNPAEKAEKFNKYFANIGPDLAKSIPTSKKQPTSYLKNEFPKSMFFLPVVDSEIGDIIANLKI